MLSISSLSNSTSSYYLVLRMRKWWFIQLGSRVHTRKKTRNNGCRCQSLSSLLFHPTASETSPPRAQERKAENRCGSRMPSPSLGRDSGVGTAVTSRERLSSPESLGPGAPSSLGVKTARMGKADTERLSPWKRQSICMRLHNRSLFLSVLRGNVVMVVIVVSSKKRAASPNDCSSPYCVI